MRAFFDALEASGQRAMRPDQPCQRDAAEWIADVVSDRCPDAIRCADPFHVVGWATEALDAVRREAWSNARRAGHTRKHGWAMDDAPPCPSGQRKHCDAHATRCGRTRKISPTGNGRSWNGSPRSTRGSTAPTSSKKAYGRSSNSPPTRPARRWTGGSPGHGAAASNHSSGSNVASSAIARRSWTPAPTAYQRARRIDRHQDATP